MSRSVTLVKGEEYLQQVGTLLLDSSTAIKTTMEIDIEKRFSFILLDNNGDPFPGQDVYLTFNYVSDTPT